PEREPEPGPWDPGGTEDLAAFPWSVQAGDATADGAVVSIRTTEPAVELVVVAADGQGWVEVARVGLTPVEGTAQHVLTGLAPDAAHRYTFFAGDGARRSRVGRLRTALASGSRKLVFGATSCLGDADPGWPNLGFVAQHQLDFFVWLGDTVYVDDEDTLTLADYRAVWDAALATPTLADTCASTSFVAVWDDHEVANNWVLDQGNALDEGITAERLAAADAAFREAMPQRAGPSGGKWRSLRWGAVLELVALDCRSERSTDRMVSDEQLAWAVERITTSDARFVVVLVSVHATDHTALMSFVEEEDRWQGYPAQRDVLVAACEQAGAVLFVTGDMHYGAVQRVSPAGAPGQDLYEVAAGPSGSELFAVAALGEMVGGLPAQYEDVIDTWSWSRFEVDPGLGTIRVQMIGDTGEVLIDRTLLG
ncbi:MAG: alkaline phosphatase D family protein, partial [Myxococcota bacterium]